MCFTPLLEYKGLSPLFFSVGDVMYCLSHLGTCRFQMLIELKKFFPLFVTTVSERRRKRETELAAAGLLFFFSRFFLLS